MITCAFVECGRPPKEKDFCHAHYMQKYRGEEVRPLRKTKRSLESWICSFDGCDKGTIARQLCSAHYNQTIRGQELRPLGLKISEDRKRKESYVSSRDGYRLLYRPDHPNSQKSGRIFEHIFILSEHLGRPLTKHENVHHKNGQRADNRLSNLELWSVSQPAGQRVADRLDFYAEELLKYSLEFPDAYQKVKSHG